MLKLLMGGIIGVLMAAIIQAYTNGAESSHISTVTNIIIAIATVAAVFITQQQASFQKRSRLWEANKEPLLDLSRTISDALQVNSLLADEAFDKMNNIPVSSPVPKSETKVFRELDEKLRYIVEVYEPLLNMALLDAIKRHLKYSEAIDRQVADDEIDVFEAYEKSSSLLRNLLKSVNGQIKDYATA